MGYIPENVIDQVRDAAGIVDVVGTYVNLRQAGRTFKGHCPFHQEKDPSFTVNPDRGIFRCFGCGVGGNVFRFLMLHKGITFPEAVQELAERYGIEVPRGGGGRSGPARSEKATIYKVVLAARQFFEEELDGPDGRMAREYLSDRGLPPELVREFHLGYAPPGWENLRQHLAAKGVKPEWMEKAGLVRKSDRGRGWYDTFRGRVICPIFDRDGKPVAFGGRLIQPDDRQPKYMNSPETPIYRKSRILYGLNFNHQHLRDHRSVLIVEGYFDLLSLAAHGIRHTAATCGTALTADHLRLLKGLVDDAVLLFDADDAGRAAAARCLPLFVSADLDGRVLTLPDGHDPDTFVREYGSEELLAAARDAGGLMDFFLDQTLARHPETLGGRSRALGEIMRVIDQIEGAVRQDLLIRAVAERVGVSEDSIRRARKKSGDDGPNDRSAAQGQTFGTPQVAVHFEFELIRLLLLHPEAAPRIVRAIEPEQISDSRARRVYLVIADQHETAGRVSPERVIDRADPQDADLVSQLAWGDDGLDEESLEIAITDFLKRFSGRDQRQVVADLSTRIKAAQEAGDEKVLNDLLREKSRLLRLVSVQK